MLLLSQPAVSDASTDATRLKDALELAKVTSPSETPVFICGFPDCFRLFRSHDRVMAHRKAFHDSEETSEIITWNEEPIDTS